MESRSRNASRNIFFGLILKLYHVIVPFIMRTAILYLLGVQYLGLNGLFKSILSVLNLAELGVGSAMVYSMYKPIVDNDSITICALLRLYKSYYRIIGIVIALLGIVLLPFVPRLINGSIPDDLNVYVLYLLNLAATVISYWLFAYRGSLFLAHQRADIISKITFVTSTIQYAIQFIVLVLLKNYYVFVLAALVTQSVNNVIVAVFAAKYYPSYKPMGKLSEAETKSINKRIRDLFTSRLGHVITNSVDTIVISAFLGLKLLAIYQNYYFILDSIYSVIVVIFSSITAGMGNSLITESVDKNYRDLRKFTFLSCWLLTVCTSCFAVLYQPFMRMWVGEELILDYSYVILFCIYFYLHVFVMVWASIKDAAGLWDKDRFRPLVASTVNLLMNLVLVRIIGLYGIILSTILSYVFIAMPWLVCNLFTFIYKRPLLGYLKRLIGYISVCVLCATISVVITNRINVCGFRTIILFGLIAVCVTSLIQYLIYHKCIEYIEAKNLIIHLLKR